MITEIYTVKETAKFLRMSVSELRKLMTLGQISYFEIGEINSKRKIKRFRKGDIDNYIRKNVVDNAIRKEKTTCQEEKE